MPCSTRKSSRWGSSSVSGKTRAVWQTVIVSPGRRVPQEERAREAMQQGMQSILYWQSVCGVRA